MIFVNSMSDLFHEDIPEDFIADVFEVMGRARQHTFQILTQASRAAGRARPGADLAFERLDGRLDREPAVLPPG